MAEEERDGIILALPRSGFTDQALENIRMILMSKRTLISHALGTESLEIAEKEDRIEFPGFMTEITPETIKAYTLFVQKLCAFARTLKRVNAKPDIPCANEKYAFRCFLVRIGFVGEEYRNDRKVLLRNLYGSSAFRDGRKKESQTEN
jgi:hypothetical protein